MGDLVKDAGKSIDQEVALRRASIATGTDYLDIPADKIKSSPFNEGLDLENANEYAESMRTTGLMEPIVVYDLTDGTYEILTGHQRYEAWCHILGHQTIKAIVRKYEKDPIKRFIDHTQANTLVRDKDLKFWLTRIDHANKLLDDIGFVGKTKERNEKICQLLGLSETMLYRYNGFKKLTPELQDMGTKGWLSSNTLYTAVSLSAQQQKELADRIYKLEAEDKTTRRDRGETFEITREAFRRLVEDIKANRQSAPGKSKRKSFDERVSVSIENTLKSLSRAKSPEDKRSALAKIIELKARLEELEKKYSV